MNYTKRLKAIGRLHETVTPFSYHYFRPRLNPPFLIWQEEGPEKYYANNRPGEFTITGSTDYFTKKEFDPVVDELIAMFENFGFSWELSTQYEQDPGVIHHTFTWGCSHGDLQV